MLYMNIAAFFGCDFSLSLGGMECTYLMSWSGSSLRAFLLVSYEFSDGGGSIAGDFRDEPSRRSKRPANGASVEGNGVGCRNHAPADYVPKHQLRDIGVVSYRTGPDSSVPRGVKGR